MISLLLVKIHLTRLGNYLESNFQVNFLTSNQDQFMQTTDFFSTACLLQ